MLRVSTVGDNAGYLRGYLAEYLLAARALLPTVARGVELGHPDAGSRLRPSDAFADLLGYACDLVAGYERELDERKGALQNGQVAVANAAGVDPDQNLTWTG